MIEENTAPKNIKLRFQCLVKDKHGYTCNARFHSLERLENHHKRQHCRGDIQLSYRQVAIDGAYITARKQECHTKSIALRCEFCHVKFIPIGCQVRTCSECEGLIKWKTKKKMKPVMKKLRHALNGRISFLTLTWALPSTLTSASRLQKRKDLRIFLKWLRSATNCKCEYVAAFELKPRGHTTIGEPLYFFHCHLLIAMPYVPQRTISRKWLEITGNSMIVDIRRVNGDGALSYVSKYIGKPVECDDQTYAEHVYGAHFYEISKGLHLINGDFWNEKPNVCKFNNGRYDKKCEGTLRYWLTTPKTVPPPVGYLDSFLMYHPPEPSASPQKQLKISNSNA